MANDETFDEIYVILLLLYFSYSLSSSMLSPKVEEEIGGRLGKVEEVEQRKKLDAQSLFMRVKVAVPTSKPLRRGGFIGGSDGTSSWVTFKYERLPLFCHFCGLMGHDLKHCADHFARGKNGGEVVYQYGEWLKAAGGRARSPQRTGSVKNHQPNHDSSTEPLTENRGSPVRRVAAEEAAVSSDTAGTLNVNGKDENSEIFPDITDVAHVTDGTSKETLEPLLSGTMTKELILNKESSFPIKMPQQVKVNGPGLIVEHVEGKDACGPQGVKMKPTWTRIARMECGPSSGKKEYRPNTLGKRGVQEAELEGDIDVEGQLGKRGRRSAELLTTETAGVQEHSCRAK